MARTTPKNDVLPILGATENIAPSREKAIVSPCSTCQNFFASDGTDADNRTPCPRRIWRARLEDAKVSGKKKPPRYLTANGEEHDGPLENPVHLINDNIVCIWCAVLSDNSGITNDKKEVISPHILAEGFDTKYIKCRPLPYLPEQAETYLGLGGVIKEWEALDVSTARQGQVKGISGKGDIDPLLFAGSALKTQLPFDKNLIAPEEDRHGIGT